MALSAGDKIGPYEITSPIGAGGMGEVYRARDTRLKRDVALKVLPGAVAADPERMSRFQREAEVLALLNHPNIAQIYGIEDRALVMELVDGESPKGPMAFEEAWKIARQIAEGLDYAHEKGIVHRDLKPANIKVTPDGVVKLLDFGLAKAFTAEPATSGNPENSPTLTMHATQVGMILGTAGYMSPEQARGRPVDKRADIWAFGVVLYELLTGEPLFKGEDVTETLAAIVKEQPDLQRAPSDVQRLLRKCLEKDSRKRLRDIGDAGELLEEAPSAAVAKSAPERSSLSGWIAAGVLTLALGALGWLHFRAQTPPTASTVRFQIAAPEGAGVSDPIISPDGKLVVYVNGTQLWMRALNSPEARPLPGTENTLINQSFWTADSRFVVFGRAGKLWKIDVNGGPPQALCDLVGILSGGFSTSDGRIVFAVSGKVQQVPPGGGSSSALWTRANEGMDLRGGNPVLPDGKHFVYGLRAGFGVGSGIYVGSLDSGETPKQLLSDSSAVAFVPASDTGGYLLFRRDATLLAQPFDTKRFELTGNPFPIAEQVGQFNASPSGALVYRAGAGERKLTWFDRQGKALDTAWTGASLNELSLSPDGSRVAVVRLDPSSSPATWVYEFARGTRTRPVPQGSSVKPVWAPDGGRLAYSTAADRNFALFEIPAAGGEAKKLSKSEDAHYAWDWSRDGRWLLYSVVDPKTKEDLWVLPMQSATSQSATSGDAKPEPFLVTDATETDAEFSPDSHYITYVSDETGKFEVYVRRFPAGDKWVVSSGGGYQPRWRRDGKELFYFTAEGRMMSVDITPGPSFHASAPKFLFQAPIYGGGATTSNHYWDVAPDGQRFLINSYGRDAAGASMTIALNWQAELKK